MELLLNIKSKMLSTMEGTELAYADQQEFPPEKKK